MSKTKRVGPRLCLCGIPTASTRGAPRCSKCRKTPMPRVRFAQRFCPCGAPTSTHAGMPRCDACRVTPEKGKTFRLKGRQPCACGAPAVNIKGSPRCDECRIAGQKRTARNRSLYIYGIDQSDYEVMLEAQDGLCGICRTDDPGRGQANFSVDHSHENEHVRGLLCHSCNVGIGLLGDNPDRLRAAADYIDSHRARPVRELVEEARAHLAEHHPELLKEST